MDTILRGLLSEAWGRSVASYERSLEYYNTRVKDGLQPHTPYVDVFNVEQQNNFLCWANAAYLVITVILFAYMKRRASGFRLRWILVLYDGSNVVIASYIAMSILRYKLTRGGFLVCNTLANDPEGYRMSWVFALFYIQKYYEFLDTWFFILRKSSRQVTFLHLFHHSSITVVVGSILPFDYNADMYLPILLNSANHTMLYLHYLLATLGLKSWWAPYITSMQLLQFCVIFAQSLLSYMAGPTCGSPDFAKVLMIVYMGSMIALFGNFFMQKYVLRRPVQSLDLCGVVKRPHHLYSNIPSQYCGTAELDATGACTVVLPDDFPDEERILCESLRRPPPFCIVYSLTAMGCAMPSLHVARQVGRLIPAAPVIAANSGTKASSPQSNLSSKHSSQHHQVKVSPNSATALVSALDKKKRGTSSGLKSDPLIVTRTPSDPPPNQMRSFDRATADSGSSLFPDSVVFLAELPAAHYSSNSNVIKSASISDFRMLPSHDSFTSDSRESSSGNLHLLLHNDRLIDGPLPLSDSFKLISQQLRSGISESIFRLTLGTLASEERGGGGGGVQSTPTRSRGRSTSTSGQPRLDDADDSVGICGALGTADRTSNFCSADSNAVCAHNAHTVPLSFSVAGGVPGATISWVVHTALIVPNTSNKTASATAIQSEIAAGAAASAIGNGSGSPVSNIGRRKGVSAVGSTGIIRSSSATGGNLHLGGGHTISNHASSGSLTALDERALSAHQNEYSAEDHQDYALDWRAIS